MITMRRQNPGIGAQLQVDPTADAPLSLAWSTAGSGVATRTRDMTEGHTNLGTTKYVTTLVAVQGAMLYNSYQSWHGQFRCSAWVKSSLAMDVGIQMRRIQNGSPDSYSAVSYVSVVANQWTYLETAAQSTNSPVPRPQFVDFQVITRTPFPPIGTVLWVDDVSIVRLD